VGLTGLSLGGGLGRYQGLYGLAGDNIVHYNVVLADGREIGVNKTSYADLFYALKGAGHNFAIVTSMVKEIYPRDHWYQKTYTWTQDKLETVFEALNRFHKSANGTAPPRMGVNYGAIRMNTSISTTEVGRLGTCTSR
jgi:FAD/FMN-containing dehydrogenase